MFRDHYRQEYFSANRSMSVVPLAIALTVSFMSAITLLGISAETYTHGIKIVQLYLGGVFGTPIVLYLYLPVFAKLNTMSVYEVYNFTTQVSRLTIKSKKLRLPCPLLVFRETIRSRSTTSDQHSQLPAAASVHRSGIVRAFTGPRSDHRPIGEHERAVDRFDLHLLLDRGWYQGCPHHRRIPRDTDVRWSRLRPHRRR